MRGFAPIPCDGGRRRDLDAPAIHIAPTGAGRRGFTKGVKPLFPFGFGLSYTTFDYSALRLSAPEMRPGDVLTVSVEVANTGSRVGKEVVQLYVRDLQASVERPFQELKGFEKIRLQPGETQIVNFQLTTSDLSFFDEKENHWRAAPGAFEVMVNGSSENGVTARFEYTG